MEGYFLDTNILTYWFTQTCPEHARVVRRIEALPEQAPLWISAITLGEVEYGCRVSAKPDKERQEEFSQFINARFPHVAPIDRLATAVYGELRAKLFSEFAPKQRKHRKWPEELIDPSSGKTLGIQENDLWIAAQAIQFNFTLVTNDNKMIMRLRKVSPDLRFENWAE